MLLSYQGSVNRWECDENDHMNVRFYVRKLSETLFNGLLELGLPNSGGFDDVVDGLSSQHFRFLKEARLALPLAGYTAIVGVNQVLTELRDAASDEVLCAVVNTIHTSSLTASCELPKYAGPRGLKNQILEYEGSNLEEAKACGFRTVGKGAIHRDECTESGSLQLSNYMGRFSDSMPNLWGLLYPEATTETEGGAVVEYRLDYKVPLKSGDRYELVSGICDAGNKTFRFAHLLFDVETRCCCVASESVGVRLDLVARKAKEVSPTLAAKLDQYQLKSRLAKVSRS